MPSLKDWVAAGLVPMTIASSTGRLPSNCTNGPSSRRCWQDGFDIWSDYTDPKVAPPGKLVEYDLTVTQVTISPDGYERLGTVFNGQYPGPLIEADWGDTLRITVHNNLTNGNGTAVHWHGIRLFETNWIDGVPGVTQCPIPPGESQVYEFRATQYGTSWYHSHFSLQYSNGLYGPLVIHGPSSSDWDVDLGPWTLTDWYHEDAFTLNWISLAGQLAPIPVSTLLNGKGTYDCDPGLDPACTGKQEYFETTFQQGTKYKMAIVNTATLLTYTFWIDGHNFTVIEVDFVPVEPYSTNVLNVGMGQRYEIVVEANADRTQGSSFWIHAHYCDIPDVIPNNKVGIIRYDESDTSEPATPPLSEQHRDFGCSDPSLGDLVPVVKKTVGPRVNQIGPHDYLTIGEQGKIPTPWEKDPRVHLWTIKNTAMYVDWQTPSLGKLTADHDEEFPPETVPVTLDFDTGEWVYFLLTSNYSLEDVVTPRNLTPSVHPIHLHGHDFAILAQGKGPFTPDIAPQLDNPPRRDVVDVDIGGYAWIAFEVDNPGAWLLHCHLQYHASEGMALQYIEQPSKIKPLIENAGVLNDFENRCASWKRYYNAVDIPNDRPQDDSGI
uniref:Dihydrogeodin oxidase n=1 Tax=Aspergillus terreus TaxID=33178 RepID=Q00292_ASPTE|nr:dihydrogeodin oxidase [Aspergillus terreus]